MSDEQDYKDYQDYIAYQQHLAKQSPAAPEQKSEASQGVDKLMASSPALQRTRQLVEAQLSPQGIQQMAASGLLPGAASAAQKGMGAMGRIGLNALTAGTAGVANENPDDGAMDKIKSFLKNGAIGGVLASGGEAAVKGGMSAADSLMRKATGIKKVYPGVGNELVDQGIIGTKDMMKDQVAGKLSSKDEELQKLVSGLQDPIDHTPVAQKVGKLSEKYQTTSGLTPESVQPELKAIQGRTEDIASRVPSTPQEALELKRIAGREGYKNGNPLANLDSKLAQTESRGYGDALSEAYAKANPELPNAVDSTNKTMAALTKASRGLNVPQGEHKNIFTLSDIAGSTIGGAAAGGPGAAIGYALAKALNTPLGKSALAHVAQKGAQASRPVVSSPESQIALQNLLQNLSQEKK